MGTPAENIIAKLGGAQKVADMLDLNVTSVHRWTYPKSKGGTGGMIPARHMTALLTASGGKLKHRDFFEAA